MQAIKNSQVISRVLDPFYEGFNILSQIFTDGEIEYWSGIIDYWYNSKSLLENDIQTEEKCCLVIDECSVVKISDPISEAIKAAEQFDFESLLIQSSNPSLQDLVGVLEGLSLDFNLFRHEEFYERFCILSKLSKVEKERLDDVRSQYIQGNICAFPLFICTPERMKYFFIFNFAAAYSDKQNDTDRRGSSQADMMRRYRTSKHLVDSVKDKYTLWETCVNGDIDTWEKYIRSLIEIDKGEDEQFTSKVKILECFITYYFVYSTHWRQVCFVQELNKAVEYPEKKLGFIKNLQSHEYGEEFCEEYYKFCQSEGINPKFDTSLKSSIDKNLESDPIETHSDWYEKIDASKVKGASSDNLYTAVPKLYCFLRDYEYISEIVPQNLFIYRFTGFLTPYEPDIKIEWTKQKNILAFMLQCLYTKKSGLDVVAPSYTKLKKYFSPEISNGSGLADSLDNRKKGEIIKKLKDCGFINVIPSKLK